MSDFTEMKFLTETIVAGVAMDFDEHKILGVLCGEIQHILTNK